MSQQSVQDMMRILPHRLGHDQRRLRIDFAKNLHPLLLRADEAVPLGLLKRMRPHNLISLGRDGRRQRLLHPLLGRPAFLIGTEAQIAVGDELDLLLTAWLHELELI
jgi:hypothetical protein